MAEPPSAGYKRRKGLPDLHLRNDLYREDPDGEITEAAADTPLTVIDYYEAGPGSEPSATLGFWTDLSHVAGRPGIRLDPKYRWLWDFQEGLAHGRRADAVQLREVVEQVALAKVKKGELDVEMLLLDLESVGARSGSYREPLPKVGAIRSERASFEGCDLAIAKLEPYLGKVIRPPAGAIGSTEWVGLKVLNGLNPDVVQFVLMLPDMCDAYRRLQSGKRHARFLPEEFLDLLVELPTAETMPRVRNEVRRRRRRMEAAQRSVGELRASIDSLFEVAGAETLPEEVTSELLRDVEPVAEE
jgi:hypothetical protein